MTLYPLKYVCKYCGDEVASFTEIKTTVPAEMTYCEKPECKAKASADYKESMK